MESYAVSAVRLTCYTMKMILGQRPMASGMRTETSEPPSISDQSPSNSSLAKAAAGKRLSIALKNPQFSADRIGDSSPIEALKSPVAERHRRL